MSLFKDIYEVCKKIPKGKVATYGQIAFLAGRPKCSRQVGWALHSNPEQEVIPCHRVINRFGKLCEGFAFGGIDIQKQLLEAEGVEVSEDYRVDLEKYLWKN
jgi:methylated-DNA-protein-cysteine methyltransferase-like protein